MTTSFRIDEQHGFAIVTYYHGGLLVLVRLALQRLFVRTNAFTAERTEPWNRSTTLGALGLLIITDGLYRIP